MRLTTTLAAAAAISVSGFAASAGGLDDPIIVDPIEPTIEAPAASSVNPIYVVLGVLAAIIVGAAIAESD